MVEPGNLTFAKYMHHFNREIEVEVYQLLVKLRCARFLDSYVATLESDHRMGKNMSMPLGLKTYDSIGGRSGTFRHVNNGIDIRCVASTCLGDTRPYLLGTFCTFRPFCHVNNGSNFGGVASTCEKSGKISALRSMTSVTKGSCQCVMLLSSCCL